MARNLRRMVGAGRASPQIKLSVVLDVGHAASGHLDRQRAAERQEGYLLDGAFQAA